MAAQIMAEITTVALVGLEGQLHLPLDVGVVVDQRRVVLLCFRLEDAFIRKLVSWENG
jgi:hypothetical protein